MKVRFNNDDVYTADISEQYITDAGVTTPILSVVIDDATDIDFHELVDSLELPNALAPIDVLTDDNVVLTAYTEYTILDKQRSSKIFAGNTAKIYLQITEGQTSEE